MSRLVTYLDEHSLRSLFGSGGGGRRREEMASSSQSKKVLKENTARARLARVWIKGYPFRIFPPASIFQRNPFQNFFHFIFFTGKSLVKNLKITFNFTWKSPIKNFLHFLQGNPFTFFPKNYFWEYFSKTLSKRVILKIILESVILEKFYKRFPCKKWRKFFIGDFHLKLKVSL